MRYADFLAFPLSQSEVMSKQDRLEVSPDIVLDVCHVTSVPPFIRSLPEMIKEHRWFVETMASRYNASITTPYFGFQNPPTNASVSGLARLRELGVRFMTIAYNDVNEYGGGFAFPNEPLSDKGRGLIRDMARTGMVLDLSHAGHRTAREALGFIERNMIMIEVVATHTACSSLYRHPRSLPDDVLVKIGKLGGLVGLMTLTWVLDPADDSLTPFIRHLSHLVNLVGENKVCMGTDGVYKYVDPEVARAQFEMLKSKIDPDGVFGARFPDQAPELNSPRKLIAIEGLLREQGWSQDRIAKVMGENLIGFLKS